MHAKNSITIVTPLAFEAGPLRRLDPIRGWNIFTCGPGRHGIETGLTQTPLPACSTVILVGTAGGLSPTRPAGSVLLADRIIDPETDDVWIPSMRPTQSDPRRGTLCTSEHLVCSPDLKATLHTRTGADAVDQEAIPFAELAQERGWNWGVVRGISDPADSALPPQASQWIDDRGQTRLWTLLKGLLKTPGLITTLPRLQRNAQAAMQAVAGALPEFVEAHGA